jgi:hypothetical protein
MRQQYSLFSPWSSLFSLIHLIQTIGPPGPHALSEPFSEKRWSIACASEEVIFRKEAEVLLQLLYQTLTNGG